LNTVRELETVCARSLLSAGGAFRPFGTGALPVVDVFTMADADDQHD
jgi:hypothetical protein